MTGPGPTSSQLSAQSQVSSSIAVSIPLTDERGLPTEGAALPLISDTSGNHQSPSRGMSCLVWGTAHGPPSPGHSHLLLYTPVCLAAHCAARLLSISCLLCEIQQYVSMARGIKCHKPTTDQQQLVTDI